MPYAQSHYPFNAKYKEEFHSKFPGDFIAEGLDQTRGMSSTSSAIFELLLLTFL